MLCGVEGAVLLRPPSLLTSLRPPGLLTSLRPPGLLTSLRALRPDGGEGSGHSASYSLDSGGTTAGMSSPSIAVGFGREGSLN